MNIGSQTAGNNIVNAGGTKNYEIDFGGHVLAKLTITDGEIVEFIAMDGWGNRIQKEKINIKQL